MPGRSAVARLSRRLAEGNRHLALAVWLLVVVPALSALALHHYVPTTWRRWANVVFGVAVVAAFAIAWLGESAKAAAREGR